MNLEELDTPVLLIEQDALKRNLERMQEIILRAGITYRPHAKAHKSPDIARMQLDYGASGICCAKLSEAEVFAEEGIQNILITSPVIGASKIARLIELSSKATVMVVVDNEENLHDLSIFSAAAGINLKIIIEINIGQNRCGVEPEQPALSLANVVKKTKNLTLVGLQGYNGSIQMLKNFKKRSMEVQKAMLPLIKSANLVRNSGQDFSILTGGGTGTSTIDADAGILTEIQPGGYIFMDSCYQNVGWGNNNKIPFEQSLTVMSTVISSPSSNRLILDMGLKSISSDQGPPIVLDLPDAKFKFAGEEHSELFWETENSSLKIGDKVRFVPTHCDTTVNLYDNFFVYSGNSVNDIWPISARGKSQ
ncbi:MAG: alanine racemase [Rhodospirillaceae bacterium]|nr:alanine racemase [Rhodospirillaceae bacterium]